MKSRIHALDWKTGNSIPTIEELCATYGVSRNTMIQALDLLRDEGLIQSTRGRGTFVIGQVTNKKADEAIIDAINNPFFNNKLISIKVLSRTSGQSLPSQIAGDLKCYDEYTRIQKLHLHQDKPFAYVDIFVPSVMYKKLPKRTDERQVLTRLLPAYADVSFSSWWEEITIAYPDDRIASLLNGSMLNPTVLVKRRRMDKHNKIVIGGEYHFRGETFVLKIGGKGTRAPHSDENSFWNFETK